MLKLKSDADQFLWPSVILLPGMLLTGIASYRAVLDDDKSRAMFTLHVQDISHDAQSRMGVYFGVLRSADDAMYRAKEEYRNNYRFCHPAAE